MNPPDQTPDEPTAKQPELVVRADARATIHETAERLVRLAGQCIGQRGRFLWALSGGGTARELFETLASADFRERIEWECVVALFGDERAVPLDDPRSNYRMAYEALLSQVPIAPENVHPMPGGAADLPAAARAYGQLIRELEAPLDLALNGMGPDGHTASLFPGSAGLSETMQRCVATAVAPLEPQVARLSLTFPVFNAARHVWLVVTGAEKAQLVAAALRGPHDPIHYPVQGLAPRPGELTWLLDSAAAALL